VINDKHLTEKNKHMKIHGYGCKQLSNNIHVTIVWQSYQTVFKSWCIYKTKICPISPVVSLSSGWEWIIFSVPCPALWTPALQACQSELSQTDTHRDTVTCTKTHINPEAHHTERTDALVVMLSLLRIFLSCIERQKNSCEHTYGKDCLQRK